MARRNKNQKSGAPPPAGSKKAAQAEALPPRHAANAPEKEMPRGAVAAEIPPVHEIPATLEAIPLSDDSVMPGNQAVRPDVVAVEATMSPVCGGAAPCPQVALIVVTRNSRAHLADLAASVRAQTHRALEVLVVDSNSTDDTREWIARHWPEAHLIASARNLGYRQGNQVGMEHAADGRAQAQCRAGSAATAAGGMPAASDYLLILNDDVELHPQSIERMVAAAERSPRVGVVAPAILLYGHSGRLNAAGSSLLPSGFYSARGKDRDYDQFRTPTEIAAASGCCFLYRREVYAHLGGFDAIFDTLPGGWHASAEDLDLCWRVWRAGYTVIYAPDALLWHKYQQRPMLASRFASLVAGRLAFLALNFPERQLVWLAPLLLTTEAALGAYSLLRGPAFARAWVDGYRWLWGNRRRLKELRGVREARHLAAPRRLSRLMQPAIRLAPGVERNPLLRLLSLLWFGVNALSLGAIRVADHTGATGGRS